MRFVHDARTRLIPRRLAGFNEDNLPDVSESDACFRVLLMRLQVFYQLWPSKEWWDHAKSVKPPQKMDVNGNVMCERTPRSSAPRVLLDYPILRNLDTVRSYQDDPSLATLLNLFRSAQRPHRGFSSF